MKHFTSKIIATTILGLTLSSSAAEPKYKADVPENILTPDKVQSKYLGQLDFYDGYPSDQTIEKTNDFVTTARAVQLFLSAIPAASIYGLLEGHKGIGVEANRAVAISEQKLNAHSLWLTPNSTTPYISGEIDTKNGPVVVELGPAILGIIDDAFFRYVADIGLGGPDRGKGGKYFVYNDSYTGNVPEGYYGIKTKSYRNWLLLRIAVKDGDLAGAIKGFKQSFKIYPYSEAKNPAATNFINISGKKYNTIHANNHEIYDEINAIIQYEPAEAYDPEIVGLAASVGIKKGQDFTPDDKMKKILVEAAAIANASARSTLFKPTDKSVYQYNDRKWTNPLTNSHEFYDKGERLLDNRTSFHYYATGITPLMVGPKEGTGSVYSAGTMDSKGQLLDGNKTYKVTLPGPIPIKNFWSFMVYSNQTRSMLETDQLKAGIDSMAKGIKLNKDGGVTIYFSAKPPAGQEGNWVQTMPDKGFNVLLRLYGPLKPWFDQTWRPSDFILVD